MKKHYKTGLVFMFCAAAALVTGSESLANHFEIQQSIHLMDAEGQSVAVGGTKAFSMKTTCGGCHDYDAIERHSYHAQLGANQHMGWDPYKNGNWNSIAPKKKPWVQSPGHVGKW